MNRVFIYYYDATMTWLKFSFLDIRFKLGNKTCIFLNNYKNMDFSHTTFYIYIYINLGFILSSFFNIQIFTYVFEFNNEINLWLHHCVFKNLWKILCFETENSNLLQIEV